MCVSLLLVLGDKIRDKVNQRTQEQWLLSYVGKTVVLQDILNEERIKRKILPNIALTRSLTEKTSNKVSYLWYNLNIK